MGYEMWDVRKGKSLPHISYRTSSPGRTFISLVAVDGSWGRGLRTQGRIWRLGWWGCFFIHESTNGHILGKDG